MAASLGSEGVDFLSALDKVRIMEGSVHSNPLPQDNIDRAVHKVGGWHPTEIHGRSISGVKHGPQVHEVGLYGKVHCVADQVGEYQYGDEHVP